MNTQITLYTRWTNLLTGQIKIMRRVLDATWEEKQNEIAERTGIILPQANFIKINTAALGNTGYVTPEEWNKLTDDEAESKYTVFGGSMGGSLIYRGETKYEIYRTEYCEHCQTSKSSRFFSKAGETTMAENEFIRKSDSIVLRVANVDYIFDEPGVQGILSIRA